MVKQKTKKEADLLQQIADLEQDNAHMIDKLATMPGIKKCNLRNKMLMAILPQVRIDYAKSDAQRALKAVDEIMEVWGM